MTYEYLISHTEFMKLTDEHNIRLLTLDMLIQTKEEANREKDRAVLAILKRVREERLR